MQTTLRSFPLPVATLVFCRPESQVSRGTRTGQTKTLQVSSALQQKTIRTGVTVLEG